MPVADERAEAAEGTAVRVALWRAMHVQVDPPPHVLEDEVGLQLAAPDDGWRADRTWIRTAPEWFRAGIVARARFVEDLVAERAEQGVDQYVILGAGLDTFAQRRPELASRLRVFEVDQPGPQAWKRRRLAELGFGVPTWLRLVPVDFERGESWWDQLLGGRLRSGRPAVVVSTGVTLYLRKEANAATLRQIAAACSRLDPGHDLLPAARTWSRTSCGPGSKRPSKGPAAAGTPFVSFYTPERDDGAGAGGRIPRSPPCLCLRAERALLRRAHGRPADGTGRGIAGRGDLTRLRGVVAS